MKKLTTKPPHHCYDPQQVLYLTGSGNYSYLHMTNDEVILSCRTLKWFETQWPHFLRVHKRALVNLAHLGEYRTRTDPTDAQYITMTDAARLEIARRRVPVVRKVLRQVRLGQLLVEGQRVALIRQRDPM